MLSSRLIVIAVLLVGVFYCTNAIKLPKPFLKKFMKGEIEIKSEDFLALITPKQRATIQKIYPDLVEDMPWLTYGDLNDIFTLALGHKITFDKDWSDDEDEDDEVRILSGEDSKSKANTTTTTTTPQTSEPPKKENATDETKKPAKEEGKPDKNTGSKSDDKDQVCSEIEILSKKEDAPVDKFKKILKEVGCKVKKGLDESWCILRLIRDFEDKKGLEYYRFNQTLVDSSPDVVIAKRDKMYTIIFDVEKFQNAVLKEKWWRVEEQEGPVNVDFPLLQEAAGWPSLVCDELKNSEDKTKIQSFKTIQKQGGMEIHAVKFKVGEKCNHYYFAYLEIEDASNVLAVQKDIACDVELGSFDKRLTRIL